jgi:hypothetical protein
VGELLRRGEEMKDRKKYFLREAVVLLIALAMVLTAIPSMTAAETDQPQGGINPFVAQAPSGLYNEYDTCRPLPRQTPNMDGGVGADAWLGYNDGYTENSLGLTSGGDITMAITLTDVELASFRDYDISEIYMSVGNDALGLILQTTTYGLSLAYLLMVMFIPVV